MKPYPVFLHLEGRRVLLVGGGKVAAAKLPALIVAAAAEERGLFVNAVDDADAGSAWLGSVVRRGDVTLAISTAGRSPALAGLLREALDRLLPEELEAWVELGETLRQRWKADGVPMRDRRPLLLRALQGLYP
jgi:uroporphyrin-III C-methyltransferase/precorrin-2 dehydrogenase/sirohydrochlorin ferrochelatase